MMGHMEWTFTGEVIEWRGPAPYLFVAMAPEDRDLKEAAPRRASRNVCGMTERLRRPVAMHGFAG
jgi:hypothetical protein